MFEEVEFDEAFFSIHIPEDSKGDPIGGAGSQNILFTIPKTDVLPQEMLCYSYGIRSTRDAANTKVRQPIMKS